MHTRRRQRHDAFTLVELLTVIAIIALLAAIIFPVFAQVREQARQANTMSNLHDIYLGARLFNEDEGRFPSALFGYAEVPVAGSNPPASRPALPTDALSTITPMDQATEQFTLSTGLNHGYLYHEQIKDYITFLNADNPIKDKSALTKVYYPVNAPYKAGQVVVWEATSTDPTDGCTLYGDLDLPNVAGQNYVGQPKLFYKMDSMDIGPMVDDYGKQQYEADGVTPKYALHYSPNWTHKLYKPATSTTSACDIDANGNPIVNQLKYKNPPTEQTIITWVTEHAATAHSDKVIILLDSGTARKIGLSQGFKQMPLGYH